MEPPVVAPPIAALESPEEGAEVTWLEEAESVGEPVLGCRITLVPDASPELDIAELSDAEDDAALELASDDPVEGVTTTTVLAGALDEAIELDADSVDAGELETPLDAASLEAAELGLTRTVVP